MCHTSISFVSNITVSKPLFVTSSIATFHVCHISTFLSNTFISTKPEISSMNGASTFISLCSFGFDIMFSFGKNGIDLFKKLNEDSFEFIMPSNPNIFLMPITKSTFS